MNRVRTVRAVLLISGIQLPFQKVTLSCWCDDYLIGDKNKQGLLWSGIWVGLIELHLSIFEHKEAAPTGPHGIAAETLLADIAADVLALATACGILQGHKSNKCGMHISSRCT
jgi:hypothetical protein